MAFTLRQFYITLKKKRERETCSGSETSKTFTGKKEKMTSRFTLDLRGQTTALVTGGGGGELSKDPPLSPQHTQATKGRGGRGEAGAAGREKYGGGG